MRGRKGKVYHDDQIIYQCGKKVTVTSVTASVESEQCGEKMKPLIGHISDGIAIR